MVQEIDKGPAVSLRDKLAYGLGSASTASLYAPYALLLLYYLTEIVGMPPGLAATAVALPKIWDALVDPIFGGWIDRLALRMGRRLPIVLVSGAAYVVSFVLLFSIPQMESATTQFIVVVLLLISFSTSQTGFSVSQYTLASEMTSSSFQLSALLSLANVMGQIFSVASISLVPILVDAAGGGRHGYSSMAIEVSIGAALAMLAFTARTRHVPVRKAGPSADDFSLLAALRATGANRTFYLLIGFMICQGIGTAALFSFLPFANQYILGGDDAGLSLLAVLVRATGLAGMAAAPWVVRWLGDQASLRTSNALIGLGLGLLFVASFGPIWVTWLTVTLVGIGAGINYVVLQTAVLEVAQLKLKGGRIVATGFYFGIMVAADKLGDSAGSFATGELLDWIGFVSGGASQAPATLSWLRAGYSLIPLLFAVLGAGFLQFIDIRSSKSAAPTALAGESTP